MALFAFAKDPEAEQFVQDILGLLTTRYQLSIDEATSRINSLWRDTVLSGPDQVAYHEPPDFWAERFYFGMETLHPEPAQVAPFSIGDVVRVLRIGARPRHVEEGRPRETDVAAIRLIVRGPSEAVLVLAAVDDHGQILWEADFYSDEIELLTPWQ